MSRTLFQGPENAVSRKFKNLSINLEQKLIWETHVTIIKQIEQKVKKVNWRIWNKSILLFDNNALIYNFIIRTFWAYDIKRQGCASMSNIVLMQFIQSKISRQVTDASWYVKNGKTSDDSLNIIFIKDVISSRSLNHHFKLTNHPNHLITPLLAIPLTRRLEGIFLLDFTWQCSIKQFHWWLFIFIFYCLYFKVYFYFSYYFNDL